MTVFEAVNQSAFFLGCILIVISCLIYTVVQHHTDKPQNRIYIAMLLILAVTAVCEMVDNLSAPMAAVDKRALTCLYLSNYFYFVLHSMQGFLLMYYAFFATKYFKRINGYMHFICVLPFAVSEILALTNPWTKIIWIINDQCQYQRQWGVYVLYAISPIYFILAMMLFLLKWSGMTKSKMKVTTFSGLIAFVGIVAQMLQSFVSTELLAESVACMGLMLAFEYDEDRVDTATGVYNRGAMIQDVSSYFDNKRRFYAICVRITNMDVLQRLLGLSDNEEIFRMVAEYLTSVHPRYMIYRATPSSFVLIHLKGNEGQVRFLAQMIAWKLEEGWDFQGRSLPLHGTLMYAAVPDELRSPDDVVLMCETPLPTSDNATILAGDDLRAILRRANLETALHRGIAEQNFRVYYQPVYAPDSDQMYSAESLIRLIDPEFGEIKPSDFIPAAERNGMIEQLGEYTLNEVCRFLESGVPVQLGMKYINVNLSVVQCLNPDFVQRVKDIVKKYRVHPSRINFEITENMAALDIGMLDSVIKELKADGFLFSLEGYGTGFANLYSIFSLDFDIIKMDKRLLWDADESEEGWTILDNSIRLVHDLKHEVGIVGIETQKQFERTKSLRADWYQGNYFSTPLSREELEKLAEGR